MLLSNVRTKCLSFCARFSTVAAAKEALAVPIAWKTLDNAEYFKPSKYSIKNERFLAGSFADSFPSKVNVPQGDLPITLQYTGEKAKSLTNLTLLGEELKPHVDRALAIGGAVLLKGLPLHDNTYFSAFYDGLGFGKSFYIGGLAVRQQTTDKLYAASLEPKELHIEPHNEMSYLETFPDKITFYCETPPAPDCGGQTYICRNADITAQLDPKFRKKVEEKRLRYILTLHGCGSYKFMRWQDAFNTEDKEVVERVLKARNCSWTWKEDNKLTYSYVAGGYFTHPQTKDKIWYNQASAAHYTYFEQHPLYEGLDTLHLESPFHVQYGDGSEIEPEYVQQVRNAAWNCGVAIPWEAGDVLILDNLTVQHARVAFEGKRKLYVALSELIHTR